ncbi:hypothetical protein F7230_03035 [Corynebacterium sp. 320]|uniref:alpha/beta hydrolase n=1 Tax=Corynebacterium TaxID=1716 RepID=UPI00125CCF17|nr:MULTISPECIES: alpha/beta-hydrolase family protein [Corynebacterium]KAB1504084.1 hypothetical protein F7230_03035 [Corynebacterium sp. 320]KAB1552818.1 hypothetical protein F7233_03560 [Corynebacterium sp. 321]KAB1553964.1 hypothetical protein F7232_03025 [Corynebacterium sp. 319]KAB3528220.1 hypothetical protein F8354_03035 [Corynebacterium sp. 250]KAB3540293.1 hypothetical protein F8390_03305 [Corynebacterium sp. 366]
MARDKWEAHVDSVGLLVGALMFALSLTPSILPRDWLFQGVCAGLSAGTGYAVGVFVHWVWNSWLERRMEPRLEEFKGVAERGFDAGAAWLSRYSTPKRPSDEAVTKLKTIAEAVLVLLVVVALILWSLFAVHWQQEVAALTDAEAYSAGQFLLILPVGLGLWALLVLVGKGFLKLVDRLQRSRVGSKLGEKGSQIYAWIVAFVLVLVLVDSVLPGAIVGGAERVFSLKDQQIREDLERPTVPERSGSTASENAWEDLGGYGTRFTSLGLYKDELEELTGRPSKEPIRVYAGLKAGKDDEERAQSVVRELERTGAAHRKALMVAPATGTGWVNPTAAQAFELLFDGDSAIASAQYSYLPSVVQLLADRERVEEAGAALVTAVVDWWQTLPENDRPKLYVYGESLGTSAGAGAFSGLRDIVSSVDGVLWLGPPNSNTLWRDFVDRRDPGSPEVSPEYAGGLSVRFAQNEDEIWQWPKEDPALESPHGWRFPRVLFIQHPSDPVVWWSPRLLFEEPDWLKEPPGFDRSASMHWMPFVTFWQVTLDLPVAANVPNGHGHNYGNSVLSGLMALVGGEGFTEARRDRLEAELNAAMAHQGPEKEVGVKQP